MSEVQVELPQSRYDLGTYFGRVRHSIEIASPFTLFHTNTSIQRAQRILDSAKLGKHPLDKEFWKAKQLVDSSVHPDTGEIVFIPFRMSSYVLSNLFITAGMLTPNMGNVGTIFWQVMNQSLNVAVNTANANKSDRLTAKQLVSSYFLAVGASCGVATGLNSVLKHTKRVSCALRNILSRLVPFAAVISAGFVNICMMRRQEMKNGIIVYDVENGQPLGMSCIAARKAVCETAISRAVSATPVMMVPPLLLYRLQQGPLRGKSLKVVSAANLALITATSYFALPFALALFPQRRVMHGDLLEPQFAHRRVWFNRGI